MNADQAKETVRAIEQVWNCSLAGDYLAWEEALLPLDSLTAAAAILRLSERHKEHPEIADIVRTASDIQTEEDEEKPRPKTSTALSPAGGRVYETPEWVSIWSFMRFAKKDFRMLSQQDYGFVAGLKFLTPEEYEEIRQEWIAAGSPRMTASDLVKAMS